MEDAYCRVTTTASRRGVVVALAVSEPDGGWVMCEAEMGIERLPEEGPRIEWSVEDARIWMSRSGVEPRLTLLGG